MDKSNRHSGGSGKQQGGSTIEALGRRQGERQGERHDERRNERHKTSRSEPLSEVLREEERGTSRRKHSEQKAPARHDGQSDKLEQKKGPHQKPTRSHNAGEPLKSDISVKVGVLILGDGVPPLDLACVDLLRMLGELPDVVQIVEATQEEKSTTKEKHIEKKAVEETMTKGLKVREQPTGRKPAAETPADEQSVVEELWEVIPKKEKSAEPKATEELPGGGQCAIVQTIEAKPHAEYTKPALKSVSFAGIDTRPALLERYSEASLDRVTLENTKSNSTHPAVINSPPRFRFYYITEKSHGPRCKSVGVMIDFTDTIETCPPLDLLIICSCDPPPRESMPVTRFISWQYNHINAIFTVGAGIASLIDTGILNSKAATGRRDKLAKLAYKWPIVEWKEKQWVRDGKVWTTANGITAIDMMVAFIKELCPKSVLDALLSSTGAREGDQEYD
ncbi:MAG: hypothetical protein M1836_007475 [Candelina mexicana]|nr:MAG: hypothetical protein M1836_007475 [Candelina mexicana]